MHEYWRHAGLGFARSIDSSCKAQGRRQGAAAAEWRARCALAQQIKWQHLRYAPADIGVWGVLNRIYAFAELRGVTEARVKLYTGGVQRGSSSSRRRCSAPARPTACGRSRSSSPSG